MAKCNSFSIHIQMSKLADSHALLNPLNCPFEPLPSTTLNTIDFLNDRSSFSLHFAP